MNVGRTPSSGIGAHRVAISKFKFNDGFIVAFRFHGNEKLVNGPRFHMMMEADQKLYFIAMLEIKGVVATDRGDYRAVAKNKHGESVATINLNFDSTAGGAPK